MAEQIDRLYWASGAPDAALTGYGADVLGKGIDLNDSEWVHALGYHDALEQWRMKTRNANGAHSVISTLPDEWPEDDEVDESGLEKFADSTRLEL